MFKYLKTWLSEIKCPIENALSAFIKYRNGWTVKMVIMNKFEAFEMWIHRRVLKIPRAAQESNKNIIRKMNRDRGLLTKVKKRKITYLRHIMRNRIYHRLQLIIEGKITDSRGLEEGEVIVGQYKTMDWVANDKRPNTYIKTPRENKKCDR